MNEDQYDTIQIQITSIFFMSFLCHLLYVILYIGMVVGLFNRRTIGILSIKERWLLNATISVATLVQYISMKWVWYFIAREKTPVKIPKYIKAESDVADGRFVY